MHDSRQGKNERLDAATESTEIALAAVSRWKRRLENALERLPAVSQGAEDADRLERIGSTLLAEMHRIPRGASHATLPDYSGEATGTIELDLDPSLPVRAQAERLLKSARKSRRRGLFEPQRRMALSQELQQAEAFALQLGEPLPDRPSMLRRETLLVTLQERLLPRGLWPTPPRIREAPVERKPIRWPLEGGWILMAGRSGAENDFLTTRIARPDDLWFHVANVPGAHVVLRSPDGKSVAPPPELVERAASLAAWLSRLRAQSLVEVRYTERKRVRKPRKAPPGSVVMEQSRSILIQPAPPPAAPAASIS